MNIELLPLPSPQVPFIDCDPSLTDIRRLVRWYEQGATEHARINVAHVTAAKDAEIEALRAEVEFLRRGIVPRDDDMIVPVKLLDEINASGAEWKDRAEQLAKEVEALRAEVEKLRAKTACTMGVGRGDGSLFVHGDYESIKAAQALVLRSEQAEALAKRLAEALRRYRNEVPLGHQPHMLAHEVDALLASCAALTKENSNDRQSTHAPD